MRILSRYLLREHLGPFLFAFGALTGLLVLNQLARQFGSLVGKGLTWSVIGEVFGLSFPFILAMTVPMAVLVAVLHAFSRLGADNEITALKASGVDLTRLVRPVLVAGVLVAAATFVFVDQLLPRSNHRLKNLMVDIARKKPTFELKEQMVNEVVPSQVFLRAGRIDQATSRLREVVIYDLANEARKRTIYADSGYMRMSSERTDLYLTLYDGYVHDYDRTQTGLFRRVFFKTDFVRVQNVSNTLERTEENSFKSDREMTICEMETVVRGDHRGLEQMRRDARAAVENDLRALLDAPRVDPSRDTITLPPRRSLTGAWCAATVAAAGIVNRPAPPDTTAAAATSTGATITPGPRPAAAPRGETPGGAARSPGAPQAPAALPREPQDTDGGRLRGQLHVLTSRHKTARLHAAMYQVEIHKKFSIAASCIVFVLIGAPVALRFPRGGVGLVIGASVVIFGFYYIGLIGGETLADQLIITPFWAMWGPNLLMSAAGLVLFLRLGREHASARGGTWRDALSRRRRARRAATAARERGTEPRPA